MPSPIAYQFDYMVGRVPKRTLGCRRNGRALRVFFEPFGWQRGTLRNFPAIGTLRYLRLRRESERHGHRRGFHGISEFNRKIAFSCEPARPRRRQSVSRRRTGGLWPLRGSLSRRSKLDPTEHRLCVDGSWVRRVAESTARG